MMNLESTLGYFSIIIRTMGIASSCSFCNAKITSYFGYSSVIAASKALKRLLSKPHNGLTIVTPGADILGRLDSRDGRDLPEYLFLLYDDQLRLGL